VTGKKKPVLEDGLRVDRRRGAERSPRLPVHARLAPARRTVVMMRMMVDPGDHAGQP